MCLTKREKKLSKRRKPNTITWRQGLGTWLRGQRSGNSTEHSRAVSMGGCYGGFCNRFGRYR